MNSKYYTDLSTDFVILSLEERLKFIQDNTATTILKIRWLSDGDKRNFGFYTRNKALLESLYGDYYKYGKTGKTLTEQINLLLDVLNNDDPEEFLKVCFFFDIDTSELGGEDFKIRQAIKSKVDELELRKQQYKVRGQSLEENYVYGLCNVMYNPKYMTKDINIYARIPVDKVIGIWALDLNKLDV